MGLLFNENNVSPKSVKANMLHITSEIYDIEGKGYLNTDILAPLYHAYIILFYR